MPIQITAAGPRSRHGHILRPDPPFTGLCGHVLRSRSAPVRIEVPDLDHPRVCPRCALLQVLDHLRRRLWSEYEFFYDLAQASDSDLRATMKDSDFDARTGGRHRTQWCIDTYRERCRGRSIQAGNDYSHVRSLVFAFFSGAVPEDETAPPPLAVASERNNQ